jgi:hypothetical protein
MVISRRPHSLHGWGFFFPSLPSLSAALLAVTEDFHSRHHCPVDRARGTGRKHADDHTKWLAASRT